MITLSTPASKVFTMVYILLGIGVLIVFVDKVARSALEDSRLLRERRPRDESK